MIPEKYKFIQQSNPEGEGGWGRNINTTWLGDGQIRKREFGKRIEHKCEILRMRRIGIGEIRMGETGYRGKTENGNSKWRMSISVC